jgi:lactobin A/cerein 7B family class IIb bacteriocin
MKLTNKQLQDVKGGSVTLGVGLMIIAGIVFIIGVIDGYVRPLPCRK